jgi:hypothetical protein
VEEKPDLRISHVGYDRANTVPEDINAYFPLARLHDAVAAGRIGSLAPRFHGAPTNRSHRVTMETDAPELLRRCREDAVDAASWFRPDRSATRPWVWPPGTWRRTASRP